MKRLCFFAFLWALFWTFVGALYIGRVGILPLLKGKDYTFVITPDGVLNSIKSVADLITLEIRKEFVVQDTTPYINLALIKLGGRKTNINFVVLYKMGFDISKIDRKDVKIGKEGDTLVIDMIMPEPKVDVIVEKWWVIGEEVGILGFPMKSFEISPIFDSVKVYAKVKMKQEMDVWNKQLVSTTQAVLSSTFSSIFNRNVKVNIKGFRSTL